MNGRERAWPLSVVLWRLSIAPWWRTCPLPSPDALRPVVAFLEALDAVLRDVAFDLRNCTESAEELRSDLGAPARMTSALAVPSSR